MSDSSPSFPDPVRGSGSLHIEQTHPRLAVNEDLLRQRIRHVIEAENVPLVSLVVVLADHDTVLQLNRDHLDHDYHTDVLAFPLGEGLGVDGEIYVDLDTAQERHEEFQATFEDEVHRYLIHGLLHLMGYDDHNESDRSEMRRKENEYLAHDL